MVSLRYLILGVLFFSFVIGFGWFWVGFFFLEGGGRILHLWKILFMCLEDTEFFLPK